MLTKKISDIIVDPKTNTACIHNVAGEEDVKFLHDYCIENRIPRYVAFRRNGLSKIRLGIVDGALVRLKDGQCIELDFSKLEQPAVEETAEPIVESMAETAETVETQEEVAQPEVEEPEEVAETACEPEIEPTSEETAEVEEITESVDYDAVIADLTAKNKELEKRVADLTAQNDDLFAQLSDANNAVLEKTAECEKLVQQLKDKDEVIANLNSEILAFHEETEIETEAPAETDEVEADVEDTEDEVDDYGEEYDMKDIVDYLKSVGIKSITVE